MICDHSPDLVVDHTPCILCSKLCPLNWDGGGGDGMMMEVRDDDGGDGMMVEVRG